MTYSSKHWHVHTKIQSHFLKFYFGFYLFVCLCIVLFFKLQMVHISKPIKFHKTHHEGNTISSFWQVQFHWEWEPVSTGKKGKSSKYRWTKGQGKSIRRMRGFKLLAWIPIGYIWKCSGFFVLGSPRCSILTRVPWKYRIMFWYVNQLKLFY